MHEGGWIGSWSPGIGDPTWVGWATVVLYFFVAYLGFRVQRDSLRPPRGRERRFWQLFVIGALALGINKQLDLQTALAELGRLLAHRQGWYESRRQVQYAFLLLLAALGLVAAVGVGLVLKKSPRPTALTALGCVGLILFVLVRATSFHAVDAFLGRRLAGLRWNWILEVGSLLVMAVGSVRRRVVLVR